MSEDHLERRRSRGPYSPAWQCTDCGTVHDEYPAACEDCGGSDFEALERW